MELLLRIVTSNIRLVPILPVHPQTPSNLQTQLQTLVQQQKQQNTNSASQPTCPPIVYFYSQLPRCLLLCQMHLVWAACLAEHRQNVDTDHVNNIYRCGSWTSPVRSQHPIQPENNVRAIMQCVRALTCPFRHTPPKLQTALQAKPGCSSTCW